MGVARKDRKIGAYTALELGIGPPVNPEPHLYFPKIHNSKIPFANISRDFTAVDRHFTAVDEYLGYPAAQSARELPM